MILGLAILEEHRFVTDRRTDGRTDTRPQHITNSLLERKLAKLAHLAISTPTFITRKGIVTNLT